LTDPKNWVNASNQAFHGFEIMASVPVQIVEYISDDQPGFVAAQLVDAYGVTHTFHDKVPVFGCDPLDRDSALPVSGWLGCEIIERFTYHGRELARIDTEKPTYIVSIGGCYQFVVVAASVVGD
jgi:hypothetical protein